MNLYGIIYLSVTKDEETYPCQHEKVFVTEDEREEAFEKIISEKWQEACNDDEDLDPERKEEFYDYDSWHYTNCYGDEYIVRKTTMEIGIPDAEAILRKSYCDSLHNMMKVYVPGYSTCRLAILDMRGQCLSFEWCLLPDGNRERFYVDLVCNGVDGNQVIIGHTIDKNYLPKEYSFAFTDKNSSPHLNLGELKELHDRCKEAYKNDNRRLRAWNPFWVIGKDSIKNLLDYMNTPYDEYLENIKNDKKND